MCVLEKPLWTLVDIQNYFGCSQATASKIMKESKKLGVSRLFPTKAKRDNVFLVMGLSFEEEAKKMKLLKGE